MLHHKIFLFSVQPFEPTDNADSFFEHVERLSGAVWGGHQSAVLAWSEAYMSVFLDYVARGRFVGKDQNLLSTTCLKRQDLCELVTHGDMLQYLQRTCTQCSAALTTYENHFSIKHF